MGQVLGSAVETVGAVETNERNIEMQREANKQNYQMFKEGNEFNAEESAKNREFQRDESNINRAYQTSERLSAQDFNESMYRKYQSPEAQAGAMSRLGLNPNTIQGNVYGGVSGSSGMQGSLPQGSQASSGSAPGMVAPRVVNPFGGLTSSLSQAFESTAQARLLNAQAQNQRIKNMYEDQRQQEELNKIINESDKILEDTSKTREEKLEAEKRKEIASVKLEILRNTQRDLESQTQMDTLIKGQQIKEKALDLAFKELENQFYPQLQQSQLNLNEAQGKALLSQARAALISATSMKFDAETRRYQYRFDKWKFKSSMKRYFDSMSDLNQQKASTEETVQELNQERSISEQQGRKESRQRIQQSKAQMLKWAVDAAQESTDQIFGALIPWY